ncbi:syntaxin of plants SYP7 [Strigomonas culicis]|uniref:Syntaxin of plants SYP7 n=1 Tax=Strigomonas culicis TaxID=28005 RepID=S9VWD8_9TRYP|nr:syntaxin of plants SYP7 [Strigomonas culicis]EPY21804.1 syntaxin of plants SYP7 [Strigomonas culicis]EPY27850.1 syntaxin of plants SYP7 [Strigomonas culicis]|eukprot:EPY20748.1 syntaxin of plants SYP7 [Strigomonas culicis]
MTDYIPNTDGLMRSTLRESIKRLRRIRVKAGREDEEAEAEASGDPFLDVTNAFVRAVGRTKNNINERNQGCRDHGQDRMAIEQSNEIRKDIRQMELMLEEIKKYVDQSEQLLVKANKKKKPNPKKVALLQKNFDERRNQYNDCVSTLQIVKEMDSERVEAGKKDINATKEMQFGRKAQLRAQLLGMRRQREGDGVADPSGIVLEDNTVGGGKLQDNDETKEQMRVIAQQDAKIDAGLNRIKEGVGRLKNLAVDIGAQLDMQNQMLEKTELTVDKQTKQLQTINRRLEKLMKGTKPMNCFMYVCFIVLILALVGFFLVQFNVI